MVYQTTIPRLFKLHGSLSWREYEDTIECVTTEEPARNAYHKRNVFIYPAQICDQESEQYATLYEYFRNLAEFTNLIIIGYAFRDEPINRIVANFMKNGKKCIVISPTVAQDISNIQSIRSLTGKLRGKETLTLINNSFPSQAIKEGIIRILNRA